MTFSTRNFDRLTPLAPKFPNFATQILIFRLKHTVAVVTHAHVLQNFYTTWVLGVACQKTTFRSKLGGGAGLGEHPKNCDPLHISATIEASNFKFGTQLGFGTSLPRNNDLDQNWSGSGPREHPKKFGTSYVFLQSLKLVTSNLVHNLRLGLAYQKQRFGPKLAGVLARGASEKKCGTPYIFLQPLKLATSNLVHKLGLGLAYQKTTFRTKIGGGLGKGSIQKLQFTHSELN